ncbi:MAG: ATP synthase subunit I [Proteobacteria bacterium]|nr:ATP synthase subunit I [Pseudomonadota bacterium]MDA1325557.1 ATP synthase subunit I [Pseudomonadota bacterium]
MTALSSLQFFAYFLAGVALGTFYFYAVFQTIRLHVAEAALSKILPLYLLRGGVALCVFWLIAQQGAAPLLLALLGFLGARFMVQRVLGQA